MSRSRAFLLALAFWTFIALAFASATWASYAVKGEPVTIGRSMFWAFSEWYLWGAIAPFVFLGARRYPLHRDTWKRNLAWHIPAWLVVTAIWSMSYVTLERWCTPYETMAATWGAHFLLYVTKKPAFVLLVYATMVGVAHGLDLYRAYRERERRAIELEAQLARAQLEALRSQLQPHFLFNTLHAITALVRPDPDAAERVVARLSDLLRMSLQTAGKQEVQLRHEMEFLEHYLEIQRTRFRDRLHVEIDVGPETMDAMVPSLLLQPLVENAIRHGVEPRSTAGNIQVRARRENDRLLIDVSDDGPGFNGGRDGGIGLANTRERLRQLYGDAHTLTLGTCEGGGARVSISIPWHTA